MIEALPLVGIITGNRPRLKDRPTRRIAYELAEAGYPVEWIVREDHVESYEADDLPFNVYPVDWSFEYACAHWTADHVRPTRGGFLGAFPGREWLMRDAESRGLPAALHLDDNIVKAGIGNCSRPPSQTVTAPMAVGWFSRVAASTNTAMVGCQLNSVQPKGQVRLIRNGFPYSYFLERTGPVRRPWVGPFEDDIMHALVYSVDGLSTTAALSNWLTYGKVAGGKTGMRANYDYRRGLAAARRYPDNVRLGISSKSSSPNSIERGPRHFLNTRNFNPIKITDREVFDGAMADLRHWADEYQAALHALNRNKMAERAGLE